MANGHTPDWADAPMSEAIARLRRAIKNNPQAKTALTDLLGRLTYLHRTFAQADQSNAALARRKHAQGNQIGARLTAMQIFDETVRREVLHEIDPPGADETDEPKEGMRGER